ncbi:hypothetical protein BEP19_03010 [Ammoniphilus oxalaticus]|uniref:VanZ-like domain-containing protein n=2 Tax=Ammoniphilus oxalaticus TaxID=66863 RepID=A0A419SNN2_9BACL|nr:hypothetical protein BEP19_03010 [Ammoniphilus oxalaticus]
MRTNEVVGIMTRYFPLALLVVIVFGMIFLVGYVFIYRNMVGGKRSFSKRRILVGTMLIGYVVMVIGVTFLNRGPNFSGIDLSLFSSYREAWHRFSVRHWQFVYLNILMFAPLGILLPLLHTRFKKAIWTIGAAAVATLSIETTQLLTGYGNFVVDDLFNNLLGATIGFGMTMGFITIKAKKLKKSMLYFAPLIIVLLLSGGMVTYYQLKEFGNLSMRPSHKLDLAETVISLDVQLDPHKNAVPIYRTEGYTKEAALKFVYDFFEKENLDTANMEIIAYQNSGIYWTADRSHSISIEYLDASYSYTDYSSFEEDLNSKDIDEATLIEKVRGFGIDVPQDSFFEKRETGQYQWTVDKEVIGNQLVDGYLSVQYYSDDTVKGIDNQLVRYDKVRNVQMKSEQEAYQEILDGKFRFYMDDEKIETIRVHKVGISYQLDSKGFYQPIYLFYGAINGREGTIPIPGI